MYVCIVPCAAVASIPSKLLYLPVLLDFLQIYLDHDQDEAVTTKVETVEYFSIVQHLVSKTKI